MIFRMECEKDYFEVENLTREAFWNVYRPGCTEHFVLYNLRKSEAFIQELDYVAVEDGKIIGNIVYARMFTEPGHKMSNEVICFGPISVHSDYQNKGIGKELIKLTIEEARALGYKAILITGENMYLYPSWDAQNKASVALAEKLGYHFDKEYPAYEIKGFGKQ